MFWFETTHKSATFVRYSVKSKINFATYPAWKLHPKLIPLVVRNYKQLGEDRKQITEQKREKREEKYQRNTIF